MVAQSISSKTGYQGLKIRQSTGWVSFFAQSCNNMLS